MAIIRREPTGWDLWNLRDEMDQLFNSFFGRREHETGLTSWNPRTDIVEDTEKFTLKMDLPGIRKDEIKISLVENTLTISGDRRIEREEKNRNYHRVERSSGSFSRSFTLPLTVKAEHIEAGYKNGVLEVYLPKTEEVKPKEITIKVD